MPPEGLHRITDGLRASLHPIDCGATEESAVSYSSEANAIFAAFTTPPTTARKSLIDTFVVSLKSAGIWTKLDVLHVLAAADSQAALINWKNPGTFNATTVNSPTFTADRGFTGNATTAYIDTGFNPTTATTPNYTRDSACLFGRILNNVVATIHGSSTTQAISLVGKSAGVLFTFRLNNTAVASVANSDSTGFWSATRSGASAMEGFKNGASILTSSIASEALISQSVVLMRNLAVYSSAQLASAGSAGHLNSTEQTALYNAERAYMTGVGVP